MCVTVCRVLLSCGQSAFCNWNWNWNWRGGEAWREEKPATELESTSERRLALLEVRPP